MTTYYRTTDTALIDLSLVSFNALASSKRELLKVYSIDAKPVPSSSQYVAAGPVVVQGEIARKTWSLVEKSAQQLAADQFSSVREAELAQIRLVYVALKNGTGTAAERLTRIERVLARVLKDTFGEEPL